MGQKIIPISLRLKKNENWHSKWVVEKNEYPNLLHFDLEVRKYFEKIFNYRDLKLIKLNIIKTSKNIYIYVYIIKHPTKFYKLPYNKFLYNLNLYYKNNNIKLFIKNIKIKDLNNLKKKIKKIIFFLHKRKNKKKIDQKRLKMIYNFSYSLYTKNINIISYYIKENLQRKKNHKILISKIDQDLKEFFCIFSNFIGYRLQFKGRLNGSKRKKKIVYQKGKVPLNSLKYDIKYHFNEFQTPSGICSIKFWVFLQKKNKF